MKLSSRLLSCASMVRPGGVAADVGTDHGYLAVYLVEQGICPVVFASDIREGPLSAARRSAEKAGLTEQIRFCLSDGLRELPVSGIDTVICAGMGGENIIHILESEPKVFDPEKQLITSGHATAEYLKNNYPGKRIYLFGNPMVKMEFESRGVEIDEEHPDLVVTSFCTSFHYRDLCRLCDLVREGLPYVATHPDFNCPTKTGFIPDIGSLSAYVEASTGRRPDKIVGKPEAEIIDYALRTMGAKREESCVVGDRLYTDGKSGVNNGLYGIFVLSGEAQLEDLPDSDVKPHLVFDSVKEIIPYL